jgi:hypothetical protein
MTIGEHIKILVNAPVYLEERIKVSDEVIEFIRDNMPSSYNLFKEKEEAFQAFVKLINGENI